MRIPSNPSKPRPSKSREGVGKHRSLSNSGMKEDALRSAVSTASSNAEGETRHNNLQFASSASSPKRGSVSMGTGRARLLLCLDDEDVDIGMEDKEDNLEQTLLDAAHTISSIELDPPHPPVKTDSADMVELAEAIESHIQRHDSAANTVSTSNTNDASTSEATALVPLVPETTFPFSPTSQASPTSPPSPTALINKSRGLRRASKADLKFAHLEQVLPEVKLDNTLRVNVVEKMKDLDYWSSESDDDDGNVNKKNHNNQFYSKGSKKENKSGIKAIVQKSKTDKNKSNTSPNHSPTEKKDEKRVVVVERAVEELVKLKKQRQLSEQLFYKSLPRDVPQVKKTVAHKIAIKIYEKALKKEEGALFARAEKYVQHIQRQFHRKVKLAYRIYLFWKNCRIRRNCSLIHKYGQRKKLEEYLKEQEELKAFELRTQERQQKEQVAINEYLDKLKRKREIEEQKEQEKLKDEQLFATDYEHRRPDLAPFSTHYFNMIQNLATQTALSNHNVFNNSTEEIAGDLLSLKIAERRSQSPIAPLNPDNSYPFAPPTSPRGKSKASSSQSIASQINESYSPTRQQTPSHRVSFSRGQLQTPTSSSSPKRGMVFTPQSSLALHSYEDFNVHTHRSFSEQHDDHHMVDVSAWWEQLATVDISIAELQAQKEQEKAAKDTKRRSAAYRALEKLSGLKEEDIKRQNDLYKVKKGRRTSSSFLNAGVL